MKWILIGVILLAGPLQAQPGGNCAVAQCPENFMPTPTSSASNLVSIGAACLRTSGRIRPENRGGSKLAPAERQTIQTSG